MKVKKLKQRKKNDKIYSLTHFTGDDKYVISSLDTKIINAVQSTKEVAVFSNKTKALDFWNKNILP